MTESESKIALSEIESGDNAEREERRGVSPFGAKVMLCLVYGALALLFALFLAADLYHYWRGRVALSPEGLGWRCAGIALSLGLSAGFWAWSVPKAILISRAKQSESLAQIEGEGAEAMPAAIADAPNAKSDNLIFINKLIHQ